jgi:hypothetical protein
MRVFIIIDDKHGTGSGDCHAGRRELSSLKPRHGLFRAIGIKLGSRRRPSPP